MCRWNISINLDKCAVVIHTLKKDSCPGLFLHGSLPQANELIYLGLTLDKRLTIAAHTRRVRASLDDKLKKLH